MSLIPYKPFGDIERFFEDWDLSETSSPRMDVYETEKDIVVEAELPGTDPKNIDVEVTDKAVKIEAKREEEKKEEKKGYYRRELSKGYCKRVIPLPAEVIENKARAEYKDGLLKISVPKAKPTKTKEKRGVKVKIKK